MFESIKSKVEQVKSQVSVASETIKKARAMTAHMGRFHGIGAIFDSFLMSVSNGVPCSPSFRDIGYGLDTLSGYQGSARCLVARLAADPVAAVGERIHAAGWLPVARCLFNVADRLEEIAGPDHCIHRWSYRWQKWGMNSGSEPWYTEGRFWGETGYPQGARHGAPSVEWVLSKHQVDCMMAAHALGVPTNLSHIFYPNEPCVRSPGPLFSLGDYEGGESFSHGIFGKDHGDN